MRFTLLTCICFFYTISASSQAITVEYKNENIRLTKLLKCNSGYVASGLSLDGPLILQLDTQGIFHWSHCITRTVPGVYWGLNVDDVHVTPSGYIYVSGHDISEAVVNNVFLIKLDPSGNVCWKKSFSYNGFNQPPYYSVPVLRIAENGGEAPLLYLNKNQPFGNDNYALIEMDSSGIIIQQHYINEQLKEVCWLHDGRLVLVSHPANSAGDKISVLNNSIQVLQSMHLGDGTINSVIAFANGGFSISGNYILDDTLAGYYTKFDDLINTVHGFSSKEILFNSHSSLAACSNGNVLVAGTPGFYLIDADGNFITGRRMRDENGCAFTFISTVGENESALGFAQYASGPFYYYPALMRFEANTAYCYSYFFASPVSGYPSQEQDTLIQVSSGTDFMYNSNDVPVLHAVNCNLSRYCGYFYPLHTDVDEITISNNPSSDRIHAVFASGEFVEWQIIDIHGKIIQSGNIINNTNEIDIPVNTFSSGLYILQLKSNQKTASEKFVKN